MYFFFILHSQVKRPMHMAKVVVKLLNGDYADEGGVIADLRLMVENCRRYAASGCRRWVGNESVFAYRCARYLVARPS